MVLLLATALPSNAPAVVVNGEIKSSWSLSVQLPVVRLVASVLYWKSIWSVRLIVPNLHCSPLYVIFTRVIVEPVLFKKKAPIVGTRVPDCKPPNALSEDDVAP